MGQATVITRDSAEGVRKAIPSAAAALLETEPGYLDRFLKEINFPPRQANGQMVGRGTYQILFDRKLAVSEAAGPDADDIANWLYCEWTAESFKSGDRFVIAAGTITKDNEVDVSCAGLAVIRKDEPVTFFTAGTMGFDDGEFQKIDDLTEQKLQSRLSSFRSGFVNGATLYSGDLEG